MRQPAKINPWLSPRLFAAWVKDAPDRATYQMRLAIWLTDKGQHAHKVAETLHVSKQAVWLWVGQYNKYGPKGLDREGRGGRRWAFLEPDKEAELLAPFMERAARGERITAKMIQPALCEALDKKVSLGYVYNLMHRNNWDKHAARYAVPDETPPELQPEPDTPTLATPESEPDPTPPELPEFEPDTTSPPAPEPENLESAS